MGGNRAHHHLVAPTCRRLLTAVIAVVAACTSSDTRPALPASSSSSEAKPAAEASPVATDDVITAAQYNDLRTDAIGPYGADRNFPDNIKTTYGTGATDGEIYSDGSSWIFDSIGGFNIDFKVSGTTRLQITSSGFALTGNQLFDDNEKIIMGTGIPMFRKAITTGESLYTVWRLIPHFRRQRFVLLNDGNGKVSMQEGFEASREEIEHERKLTARAAFAGDMGTALVVIRWPTLRTSIKLRP